MACEFICDGCDKRAPGSQGELGTWHKPRSWFERSDGDGIQTACSRECVGRIAERTGKTSVVLPV